MHKSLIGTWALRACKISSATGAIRQPYGTGPIGVIIYTAQGWMSCHMAFGGEAADGDAVVQYSSYHGNFTVNEATESVVHHAQGSSIPEMVGADLERKYTFEGDRLILRANDVEVIWQKFRA